MEPNDLTQKSQRPAGASDASAASTAFFVNFVSQ